MSINDEIAKHKRDVEALARTLANKAARSQTQQDDLVQEGLIQVWQNIERGVDPMHRIEGRMLDYIRYERAQIGERRGEPLKYETILPLDDYRALDRHSYNEDVDRLADGQEAG